MVFKHKDPGGELTQAEFIAACGDGHIFASQATGDILYASSATVLSKLARGAANTVLSMGGSCIPAWTATPSLSSLTVDDVVVDGKVVTMTGSACDTVVMTAAANGAFSLVTTDTAAAAANITITADGTVEIDSTGTLTLDASTDIVLDADGDNITFKAGSGDSTGLDFSNSSGTWTIKPGTADADLIFNVNDGCVDTKVMAIDGGDSVVTFGGNSVKSGEIRILEDTDSGANYTAIKVGNMAANVTYTLPTNVAASCGLFLKSTCAGVLSWAAAGGGLDSCADAIIHNGYGIVIGHTGVLASGDHPANTVGEFTMIGAAGGDTGVHILRHSADAGGGAIRFAKSRNATVASHTVVQACDTIGEISWFGCDGGDFQPFAATIKVLVDGTPGTNDMPGRMDFSTTADGAESPTLAMRIDKTQCVTVSAGNLVIGTAGKGIDFSAQTQSTVYTAASELLDHYEEGSWTPILEDTDQDDVSQSGDQVVGRDTRIGNRVFISGHFRANSLGSMTTGNTAHIGGLPFTSANVSSHYHSLAVSNIDGFDSMTAGHEILASVYENNDYVTLRVGDSAGSSSAMTIAEFSSNGNITITGSYNV